MGDVPRIAPRPLFVDRFDSDTRANYTYLIGTSASLSVSGGRLFNTSTTQKLIVPTGLASRKSLIAKLEVTIDATLAASPGLGIKMVDASNHVYAILDTGTTQLQLYKIVGGAATLIQTAAVGTVRTSTWLLGGCIGNAYFCNAYAADPETTIAAPTASVVGNITDAALKGNVVGKPGIEAFSNANHSFAELKVWAAGAHPFDL